MHFLLLLLLMPFIMVGGQLFLWLVALEKKRSRRDFGSHAEAVKRAAAHNRAQVEGERREGLR